MLKGASIHQKYIGGIVLGLVTCGCASLRDSLIAGTGAGVATGAIFGSQLGGDKTENAIKGAVIGGVVSGFATFIIHESLKKRDADVRRDTLMNLEQYDVLGVDKATRSRAPARPGKCFETQDVDGQTVSIPCHPSSGEEMP